MAAPRGEKTDLVIRAIQRAEGPFRVADLQRECPGVSVDLIRVTLKTVLASLAEGATTAEILADFPTLSEEDVRAAIVFAAASAQEDLPLAETPVKR